MTIKINKRRPVKQLTLLGGHIGYVALGREKKWIMKLQKRF